MNAEAIPRKQRAARLAFLLLWAEAGAELRREFDGSFLQFERYAALEAQRLIRSADNSAKNNLLRGAAREREQET
jgi:hypothetical protein